MVHRGSYSVALAIGLIALCLLTLVHAHYYRPHSGGMRLWLKIRNIDKLLSVLKPRKRRTRRAVRRAFTVAIALTTAILTLAWMIYLGNRTRILETPYITLDKSKNLR